MLLVGSMVLRGCSFGFELMRFIFSIVLCKAAEELLVDVVILSTSRCYDLLGEISTYYCGRTML